MTGPVMRLQTIVYTTRMAAATEWYGAVLGVSPDTTSDTWTAFPVDVARLESAEIAVEGPFTDQPFGRSVLLRDPDGSPLQIDEHR